MKDVLEYYLGSQSQLVTHFSYLRENIHRPVTSFMSLLSKLVPATSTSDQSSLESRMKFIQQIQVQCINPTTFQISKDCNKVSIDELYGPLAALRGSA